MACQCGCTTTVDPEKEAARADLAGDRSGCDCGCGDVPRPETETQRHVAEIRRQLATLRPGA